MKLTSREQEIVNILKKNPLISQEELADVFGITRSSVAVHISNLMKKGIIRGKGYVFNEGPLITIVGECYLDINIYQKDYTNSHVETIDIKYKGVPLEICKVFGNYGIRPKVITFLANDQVGEHFLKQMQELELDTQNILKLNDSRSIRRVHINDTLTYAEDISDSDYYEAIKTKERLLLNSDCLITDYKFATEIVEEILSKKPDISPELCTYIIDKNLPDIPDYISKFKVVVLGVNNTLKSERAINTFLDFNLDADQVFAITDGKSEIIAINDNKTHRFPLLPNQTFSVEEKIPSFLAGLICGILNKHPLRQAIRIAVGSI